jgi:hypothetical protein
MAQRQMSLPPQNRLLQLKQDVTRFKNDLALNVAGLQKFAEEGHTNLVRQGLGELRNNMEYRFNQVARDIQAIKDQIAQEVRNKQAQPSSPSPAKVRKTLLATSTPVKFSPQFNAVASISPIQIAPSAPDTLILSDSEMDDTVLSAALDRSMESLSENGGGKNVPAPKPRSGDEKSIPNANEAKPDVKPPELTTANGLIPKANGAEVAANPKSVRWDASGQSDVKPAPPNGNDA